MGEIMKYLILIGTMLLICTACAETNTRISVGIPSGFHDKGHENVNNKYNITEMGVRDSDNIEVMLSTIVYRVDDELFKTTALGFKKWFTLESDVVYVEIGVGAKLTEKDSRNPWLADSNLLADVSVGIGLRHEFLKYTLSVGYKFQHLSVPWRHDYGLNFDGIEFGIRVPF